MDDKQPEAAHAASEIEEPNPYRGMSIALIAIVMIIVGASILALWLGSK